MAGLRNALLAAAAATAALGMTACGSSDEGSSSSTTSASSGAKDTSPIVIGAAVDNSNFMKSIDQPPLAAAKIAAKKINDAGGIDGRMIEFKTINTQIDPAKTQAAATKLVDEGADILWVTCDVDLSTPSIQVALSKKMLTVAPCIGTDQMGPKRFSDAGKLAFSFGNVAQDEGAAMAKVAIDKGWKTANIVADKALVYTQNVCEAFGIEFEKLGGKVVSRETFTQGDNTVQGIVPKVNRSTADVDTLCTTTGKDLPAFITGLRGLGNTTPILGPWAIDGTYWLPKSAKASDNIHLVTFASIYGDDPDPAIKDLMASLKASGGDTSTGGFITGAETVETIAHAIKENGGSTDGTKLAATIEGLKDFKTSLGTVSFSPEFHTVFGREYRVIDIAKGKPKLGGTVKADAPVELGR
jgi:branched-chain amino acid transport system substrate-binding protein